MTIQQCKYAVKIAQEGSFNEAAIKLFTSQASLSEAVKNLEQELGIVIFERSNKGVNLTREGSEFIHYATSLVSQAEMISERYKTKEELKHLCIATQHYDFVAEIFSRFVNSIEKSKFTLTLQETKTYEVIESVKNSVCDLGIIAIKKSEEQLMKRYLLKNKLDFKMLIDTKPHIFVRKGHELAGKNKIKWDDLTSFPYVFYEQGENSAALFFEELPEFNTHSRNVKINDRATLMNLLLSTNCYTVGTGIMTSELNNGSIVSVPLESDERYIIGCINQKNVGLTEEAEMFIMMLNNFLKEIKAE